jgi:hypothetical protein
LFESLAPGVVSLRVDPVNDEPVAVNDAAMTDEDTPITIDVADDDTDVDGTVVDATVAIVTPPAGGSAVPDGNGIVTFSPPQDGNGVYTFTYTVEDDGGATSNAATVTVTVVAVNDPPIAANDATVTDENTPIAVDVADNDTDVDGTVVDATVAIVTPPASGSAVPDDNGIITFSPPQNGNGVFFFTYTIEDDGGATSNIATVTVTVRDVNDPPAAVDDSAATDEDTAVTVNVADNDTDVDGAPVDATVAVVSDPFGGAVNNGGGSVTYTPPPDGTGVYAFTYTIDDDDGATSNEATVTITVAAVNDPPTLVAPAGVFTEKNFGVTVGGVAVDDIDAGAENVTVVLSAGQGTLTVGEDVLGGLTASGISGNGTMALELAGGLAAINNTLSIAPGLVYMGNLNFVGEDLLSISVNDGGNTGSGGPLEAAADIEVTVTGPLYDEWLVANFDIADLEDPEKEDILWGDQADPDNDRLLNLVESFMGLGPRTHDDAEFPSVEVSGGSLRFIYRRAKSAPGVEGSVEWSDDAESWSGAGVVETVVEDLGDSERVEATVPLDGETNIFVLLRVNR